MRATAILAILLSLLAACGKPAPGDDALGDQPGWAGPRQAASAGRLDRSNAGRPAPDVEFQDPQGRPVRLADFRGRPLLVNLWATWCPPCVAEMPTLDALAARDGELQILAVSQDHDGREKVERFFAARRFDRLEPYLDPELKLMTELGVATLPTTLLYDSDGREVWRMTGMEDWESSRAAKLIGEVNRAAAR